MRHLVACLLQGELLLMNPFVPGTLQALDRLQRCLNPQGLEAFEHLIRYQTISFQPTKADTAGRFRIAEGIAALIAYDGGARVLYQQLAAAMATAQKPRQQCITALDRSTHDTSFRVSIVCKQCLIGLVHLPTDVGLVVIGNEDWPLFTPMVPPHGALATLFKSHGRSASAIGVRAGVNRVLQQTQQ